MWFTKEIQDVLKEYDSNEATGLSSQEVKLRLEKYGENKLKSKPKKSFFQLFLSLIVCDTFYQTKDILHTNQEHILKLIMQLLDHNL